MCICLNLHVCVFDMCICVFVCMCIYLCVPGCVLGCVYCVYVYGAHVFMYVCWGVCAWLVHNQSSYAHVGLPRS